MSGAGAFDPIVGPHAPVRSPTIIGTPAALARDWRRMREALEFLAPLTFGTANGFADEILATLECREAE